MAAHSPDSGNKIVPIPDFTPVQCYLARCVGTAGAGIVARRFTSKARELWPSTAIPGLCVANALQHALGGLEHSVLPYFRAAPPGLEHTRARAFYEAFNHIFPQAIAVQDLGAGLADLVCVPRIGGHRPRPARVPSEIGHTPTPISLGQPTIPVRPPHRGALSEFRVHRPQRYNLRRVAHRNAWPR